jgi:hypothetical protein
MVLSASEVMMLADATASHSECTASSMVAMTSSAPLPVVPLRAMMIGTASTVQHSAASALRAKKRGMVSPMRHRRTP